MCYEKRDAEQARACFERDQRKAAGMAEYINRAYVMGEITSSEAQAELKQMDGCEAYNRVLEILNFAPTADVAPVVHGRWVFDSGVDYCHKCSVCKAVKPPHYIAHKYCPNCGARMDGDDNG